MDNHIWDKIFHQMPRVYWLLPIKIELHNAYDQQINATA
jgi:hypothetical protein